MVPSANAAREDPTSNSTCERRGATSGVAGLRNSTSNPIRSVDETLQPLPPVPICGNALRPFDSVLVSSRRSRTTSRRFPGQDRPSLTIWRTKWQKKINPKVSSGQTLSSPPRIREMPSGSIWQICLGGFSLALGCEKQQAPQIKEMNHTATGDRTPKANPPRTLMISGPMAPSTLADPRPISRFHATGDLTCARAAIQSKKVGEGSPTSFQVSPRMDVSLAEALLQIPPDRVEALCRETERDAHRVAVFLGEFLQRVPFSIPATRWTFPSSFLLALGTGLRLLYWEDHGIVIHRDAGLPPAMKVICETFEGLRLKEDADRWSRAVQLFHEVTWLFAEHIAWHGHAMMGGEFVVGRANEDALVDVLARFLWEHRHDLRPETGHD